MINHCQNHKLKFRNKKVNPKIFQVHFRIIEPSRWIDSSIHPPLKAALQTIYNISQNNKADIPEEIMFHFSSCFCCNLKQALSFDRSLQAVWFGFCGKIEITIKNWMVHTTNSTFRHNVLHCRLCVSQARFLRFFLFFVAMALAAFYKFLFCNLLFDFYWLGVAWMDCLTFWINMDTMLGYWYTQYIYKNSKEYSQRNVVSFQVHSFRSHFT